MSLFNMEVCPVIHKYQTKSLGISNSGKDVIALLPASPFGPTTLSLGHVKAATRGLTALPFYYTDFKFNSLKQLTFKIQ